MAAETPPHRQTPIRPPSETAQRQRRELNKTEATRRNAIDPTHGSGRPAKGVDVTANVLAERIESRIFLLRGQKVMLSTDLAHLYDVEPRPLVQAVKRNLERFPADFMFQLDDEEFRSLKSQIVTSSLISEGLSSSVSCGSESMASEPSAAKVLLGRRLQERRAQPRPKRPNQAPFAPVNPISVRKREAVFRQPR